MTCETCGASFRVPPSRAKLGRARFCSRACRHEPDANRFWRFVDKTDIDGCWPWTGARDDNGYGRFWSNDARRIVQATHMAIALAMGEMPPAGAHALHGCDNPPCVRYGSDHVFVGTRSENMRDMLAKGRHAAKRTGDFRRGTAASWSRLTEADIPLIRAAIAAGEPQRQVAARFGVSRFAVRAIAKRETWAHIG